MGQGKFFFSEHMKGRSRFLLAMLFAGMLSEILAVLVARTLLSWPFLVFAITVGITLWANAEQLPQISPSRCAAFLVMLATVPPIAAMSLFFLPRMIGQFVPSSRNVLISEDPVLSFSFVVALPVSILLVSVLMTCALTVLLNRWNMRSLVRFCLVGLVTSTCILVLRVVVAHIGHANRDSGIAADYRRGTIRSGDRSGYRRAFCWQHKC
jgi:hypothetical protein